MKTKIKVAVVLNHRETHVVAGILQRATTNGKRGLDSDPIREKEEREVVEEFLRRTQLLDTAVQHRHE